MSVLNTPYKGKPNHYYILHTLMPGTLESDVSNRIGKKQILQQLLQTAVSDVFIAHSKLFGHYSWQSSDLDECNLGVRV